jgi:hypothetical protein
MMDGKTPKEIRAELCKRTGMSLEELDAWARETIEQRKPQRKLTRKEIGAKLRTLIMKLEAAVMKSQPKPERQRAGVRVKRRRQTPKAR